MGRPNYRVLRFAMPLSDEELKILNEIAERRARLHTELLHLAMAKARAGEIHPRHGFNSGLNDAVTSSALPSVPKQKVP